MRPSFMEDTEGKYLLDIYTPPYKLEGLKYGFSVLLNLFSHSELPVEPTDEPSIISVLIQSFFTNIKKVQIPIIQGNTTEIPTDS